MIKKRKGQAESNSRNDQFYGGIKLDLTSWMMARRMLTAVVIKECQVMALMGPQMDDPSGLTDEVGLNSLMITQKLLDHKKAKLLCHDRLLLTSSTNMLKNSYFHVLRMLQENILYKIMVKTTHRQKFKQQS